jgi:hypothetical protein
MRHGRRDFDHLVEPLVEAISKTYDHSESRYRSDMMGRSFLIGQNGSDEAAARKKAIVAVARQLAVDLWWLFTGQTTAENLGLIYMPDAA